MGHSEALEIVMNESGLYFDPHVVDARIQSEVKFDEMSQELCALAVNTRELEERNVSCGVDGLISISHTDCC